MKEPRSLSEILLNQKDRQTGLTRFTDDAQVLPFLPPFLLKDDQEAPAQGPKFYFEYFSDKHSIKSELLRGHPRAVYQFLVGTNDVFLDFDQLGVARLSHSPCGEGEKNEKMKKWLNYALSPELWGPEGKWTRFHERLHKLFEKHNLLERAPHPGYYPLKLSACAWEKYPFRGDRRDEGLELVLPWTFSLTDLQRLEQIFNEEN